MLFFFNMAGAVYDPDLEGVELANISDARIMAVQFAGETLRERPQLV
ncbi:DUF6894 family protein [Sphingomonas sp. M1-B02]|nr:hypothetical protein [Sphingomonas sp. S6-11]UZK67755.1 hypothetical protein OKW87_07985 [Sphingomonas sp. S6-11]